MLYTLNDAWVAWLSGEKFPIAFFGDSTYDGNTTTGWVGNKLGVESVSPDAFSKKLEALLRDASNNNILRIYNAGFSGTVMDENDARLMGEFAGTAPYSDAKMIGIGFGINDRLMYPDAKAFKEGFKAKAEFVINWCCENGKQPFLLTTQAVVNCGVRTEYIEMYPMRTSEYISSISNEVKKELACKYGLELIDLNKYTEDYLLYSQPSAKEIISDHTHFSSTGHSYEAGLLFSRICPRTITAGSRTKIDYSSQRVTDCVPEDWLTLPETPANGFKVYADYKKSDVKDLKIMNAWVFVSSRTPMTLKAYRNKSEAAYVKVNGEKTKLSAAETVLGKLDMGLYKLEVFTGRSKAVDFQGFLLE